MDIRQRIEDYLAGPEQLRQAIQGMTDAELDAAPVPGKWSTRQVVCHIADFEPVYADRMKWVLVEATHVAVRHESYFACVFHNVKRRKGKQKAHVAVARKMAQVIWYVLRERRPYQRRHQRPRVGSISCVAAEGLRGAPTC